MSGISTRNITQHRTLEVIILFDNLSLTIVQNHTYRTMVELCIEALVIIIYNMTSLALGSNAVI